MIYDVDADLCTKILVLYLFLEIGRSSYEIRNCVSCSGKGSGMVARRRILPGEIVLEEKPLFILPDEIYEGRTEFLLLYVCFQLLWMFIARWPAFAVGLVQKYDLCRKECVIAP